jgi:hypothetical protein
LRESNADEDSDRDPCRTSMRWSWLVAHRPITIIMVTFIGPALGAQRE